MLATGEAQAAMREAPAAMRIISSSQVAGLLSAVIVLIVIMAIGFLLQPLQKVILFSFFAGVGRERHLSP